MSTVTVNINAQYFENYAFSEGGAAKWKAKGCQVFNLKMDADHLMFDKDVLVELFSAMLKNQSNNLYSYHYDSHDVQFVDPIALDAAEFEAEIQKKFAPQTN